MQLTVTTPTDVFTLEVNEDMELENFKALCSLEAGISAEVMVVLFNGSLLADNKKTMAQYGVRDGDMLLVQQSAPIAPSVPGALPGLPNIDFSSIALPNMPNGPGPNAASHAFQALQNSAQEVALLRLNNPRLAEAFDKGIEEFTRVLQQQENARNEERRRRMRMLLADPFDQEAQQMIAEEIRREQINLNMENAMEYFAESFGDVHMLYIKCKVNGVELKAFVDSGAQSTIMSKACAERCNILHLIDQRFSGIARGVGTQKILGRVHLVQLEISGDFIPSSFQILENQPMDVLLGLDMLRRFQCTIDLKRNILHIGTTGTETPFLHESEIPKMFDVQNEDADMNAAIAKSLQDASTSSSSSNKSSNVNNNAPAISESQSKPTASTAPVNRSYPESVIQELVSMGFEREQVIVELNTFNGDKDQAMAALFAKSIKVPAPNK